MPDWRAYVRDHLPPLHVTAERGSDIAGELALQLEQTYADAIAAGMSEETALARARTQIGDWTRVARAIDDAERRAAPRKEIETRGGFVSGLVYDGIFYDIGQALRFPRRSPLIATIAILTLAFGIGANTAIFTIVDAVALRSLPYDRPDRLMAIETRRVRQPEIQAWTSAADFFDMRDRARSCSRLAGISPVLD